MSPTPDHVRQYIADNLPCDHLEVTGDGAHTLHEHILVSDIANRAALVTRLLSQ